MVLLKFVHTSIKYCDFVLKTLDLIIFGLKFTNFVQSFIRVNDIQAKMSQIIQRQVLHQTVIETDGPFFQIKLRQVDILHVA